MDCYIGEIHDFPYNFVPLNFVSCEGQLLSVPQYQALFALLGIAFGGDGQKTFGVPDLRSRVAVGPGKATTGVTTWAMNNKSAIGAEGVALNLPQYPSHTHTLEQMQLPSTLSTPVANTALAQVNVSGGFLFAPFSEANTTLAPQVFPAVGLSRAHENRQPYLALISCICVEGEFPPLP